MKYSVENNLAAPRRITDNVIPFCEIKDAQKIIELKELCLMQKKVVTRLAYNLNINISEDNLNL